MVVWIEVAFPPEVKVEIPKHLVPPGMAVLAMALVLGLQDRIVNDQSVKMEVASWNLAGLRETFPLAG